MKYAPGTMLIQDGADFEIVLFVISDVGHRVVLINVDLSGEYSGMAYVIHVSDSTIEESEPFTVIT